MPNINVKAHYEKMLLELKEKAEKARGKEVAVTSSCDYHFFRMCPSGPRFRANDKKTYMLGWVSCDGDVITYEKKLNVGGRHISMTVRNYKEVIHKQIVDDNIPLSSKIVCTFGEGVYLQIPSSLQSYVKNCLESLKSPVSVR